MAFRVWVPMAQQVDLVIAGASHDVPMERASDGTWSAELDDAQVGTRYGYRIDGEGPFPDPYSRSQPEGVHGPSEVVDPAQFEWRDGAWQGLDAHDLVAYECHIGTFTPEGTFDAAITKLPYLVELGVTALEIMPVAEFPGRRNWGYDGVDWFAPSHVYGGPAGLRRLVDAAHGHGLGILLDVVYNHFGPEGNYLRKFSPDYFTGRYSTPWGEALNYDGDNSQWMRNLAIDNARCWVREYHVDGFRCDATFAILDASPTHVLQELSQRVREEDPRAMLIAETHENDVRYLKPLSEGGYGFDAVWADDFHHSVRRLLAGDSEGYYRDYSATVDELARTLNQAFLYEGQLSPSLGYPRGTPARDRPAAQFVYCIQNHDQIGNRAFGDRLNHDVSPGLYRAASALLLLLPYTPLLFMGQEFGASTPFQYFTDHRPELGRLVTAGRREEFKAFKAFSDPAARERIPDPQAEETFARCKLNWREARESPILVLYRDCLRLRDDPVLRQHDRSAMTAGAASPHVLEVTFTSGAERRLLLANFGRERAIVSLGNATPFPFQGRGSNGHEGRVLLDTGDARYGGAGSAARGTQEGIAVPGETAVLLAG